MPKVKGKKGRSSEPVLGAAPKSAPAPLRTSGRVRSLSQTVRVVDEETRTAARTIRLEILEADNYGDDALGAAADDDEEFYVDDEATTVKSRAGGGDMSLGRGKNAFSQTQTLKKLRERRSRCRKLAELVAEEAGVAGSVAEGAAGVPSLPAVNAAVVAAYHSGRYDNVKALPAAVQYALAGVGAPSLPITPYCSECGNRAPYKCVRCGATYCTIRCGDQHKETRCLSMT